MLTLSSCLSEYDAENEFVVQVMARVRDSNTVWQLRAFSKDREGMDLICGFRETRGLAVRDNKAEICDV